MPKKRQEPDYPKPNPKLYHLPFTLDKFNGMPFRRFGNTGLRVSNVGLGTWKFGLPETRDGSRVDVKKAFKILDKAIEEGATFWDTANRYNESSGNSERVIGRWFRENPGQRRNVELATKIYGQMDGLTPNYSRLSRANIMEATYSCLERLQTDRIEILQFHSFDETTRIEESLMAIEDLISLDLVRYFGVSNFSPEQLTRFSVLSDSFKRARIQSVQNQFDILYGEDPARRGVLSYCAQNKLTFIAWSPLRGGLLTERYLDKSKVGPGDRLFDEKRADQELKEPVLKKLRKLADLAHEWSLTLAQLVIIYMLQLPGMGPVIAACSNPEQLTENSKAGKISLEPEQVARVKSILSEES
jgi:aryl-alcohol dehydrogenase-like predicted oxidoreductase